MKSCSGVLLEDSATLGLFQFRVLDCLGRHGRDLGNGGVGDL